MDNIEAHLNILNEGCRNLLDLYRDDFNTKIDFDNSDDFSYMSLCFMSKQADHMDAVLNLYPHPDIQLISRTMIEGLAQLLWARIDNRKEKDEKEPIRAWQWRHFAHIRDWRIARKMTPEEREKQSDETEQTERFISDYGHLFAIKKAASTTDFSDIKTGDDPFHKNWRLGKSIHKVFEEVENQILFKELYSQFSDWQHWGIGSIGGMTTRDEANRLITYKKDKESNQYILNNSLAISWHCLYQTLELVNEIHNLSLGQKLEHLTASISQKSSKVPQA